MRPGSAGGWFDPELADDHADPADGIRIDPEDVPASRFLTGPAAWRSCRAARTDPARFVVDPGLDIPLTRGWPYLRHNLVHDLAALAKHEMLLWDYWGVADGLAEPGPGQLAALDELAAAICSADVPPGRVQALYQRDGFRVPAVITSYSAASDTPQVLRQVHGRFVPSDPPDRTRSD